MAERGVVVQTFDRLESRYRIKGRLVARTALRVGGGKATDITASDQPVMRDGLGRPFIPGSSLKGALRSGLERAIRGLGPGPLRACDPFEKKPGPEQSCSEKVKAWIKDREKQQRERPDAQAILAETRRVVCTACGLFGSSYMAGRVFVHDLPAAPTHRHQVLFEVRDGVGLNRDLGTAQRGIKYDVEAVPPGTAFELELLIENADDVQYAMVLKALALLHEGTILVGGLTSRGLGRVELADGVSIERTNARLLLAGLPAERATFTDESRRADGILRDLLAPKES